MGIDEDTIYDEARRYKQQFESTYGKLAEAESRIKILEDGLAIREERIKILEDAIRKHKIAAEFGPYSSLDEALWDLIDT